MNTDNTSSLNAKTTGTIIPHHQGSDSSNNRIQWRFSIRTLLVAIAWIAIGFAGQKLVLGLPPWKWPNLSPSVLAMFVGLLLAPWLALAAYGFALWRMVASKTYLHASLVVLQIALLGTLDALTVGIRFGRRGDDPTWAWRLFEPNKYLGLLIAGMLCCFIEISYRRRWERQWGIWIAMGVGSWAVYLFWYGLEASLTF